MIFVLLKALPPVCMKYTALGESQVANTAWRETLAGGNVGEFGESSVIRQTKTIQISICN